MPLAGCKYPHECNEIALCRVCAAEHHAKLEQESDRMRRGDLSDREGDGSIPPGASPLDQIYAGRM